MRFARALGAGAFLRTQLFHCLSGHSLLCHFQLRRATFFALRLLVVVWFGIGLPVVAQNSVREVILPDVDAAVPRKLATYEEHLRTKEWDEALDFLDEILREHGSELIRVAPIENGNGYYSNVNDYCQRLIGRLPDAGQKVYQARVNAQAEQQFQKAIGAPDNHLLQNLLRNFPFSSAGGKAAFVLGQRAWLDGKPAAARAYWSLLSLEKELRGVNARDVKISAADLEQRLTMCEVAMGHKPEAGARVRKMQDRSAQSAPNSPAAANPPLKVHRAQSGSDTSLAARLLADIESESWSVRGANGFSAASEMAPTFAGNSARNSVSEDLPDTLSKGWSYPFYPQRAVPAFTIRRHPAIQIDQRPGVFPVIYSGKVFVADCQRVLAFDLVTGQAAWPADNNVPERRKFDATIFSAKAPLPDIGVHGNPNWSLTVDQAGRLFMRFGSPVTRIATGEARAMKSGLVCLDVKFGEGRQLWQAENSKLGPDWHFDGAPVAHDGRVYSVVTQSNSRLQMGIVCLSAATGRAIWTQTVCTAIRPLGVNTNEVTHRLLSVDEQHVYLSTNLGAIAAVNRETGKPIWVVTYPQTENTSGAGAPRPCLLTSGMVIAAPADSDFILALDARTGRIVWKTKLPDRIRHLLGARQQVLVGSGNSLWGLNVATGNVIWGGPNFSPVHFGFGRGFITETKVFWPKRNAIEVRDLQTGIPARSPIRLPNSQLGGNLQVSAGNLIVSGPDTIFTLTAGNKTPRTPEPGVH